MIFVFHSVTLIDIFHNVKCWTSILEKSRFNMCYKRSREQLWRTGHDSLSIAFAIFLHACVPNDLSSSILISLLNERVITRRQSCLDKNLVVHRIGYIHIGQQEHMKFKIYDAKHDLIFR